MDQQKSVSADERIAPGIPINQQSFGSKGFNLTPRQRVGVAVAAIFFALLVVVSGAILVSSLIGEGALAPAVTDVSSQIQQDEKADGSGSDEGDDNGEGEEGSDGSQDDSATEQGGDEGVAAASGAASSSAGASGYAGGSSAGGGSGASGGEASSGSSSGGSGSQSAPNTVTVYVSVSSSAVGNPVATSATLTFQQGATVYDALCAAGLSVNATSTMYGVYVSAIGGLAEKEHGSMSGWTYYVNGVYARTSCNNYVLSDGDSVSWVYVTG